MGAERAASAAAIRVEADERFQDVLDAYAGEHDRLGRALRLLESAKSDAERARYEGRLARARAAISVANYIACHLDRLVADPSLAMPDDAE